MRSRAPQSSAPAQVRQTQGQSTEPGTGRRGSILLSVCQVECHSVLREPGKLVSWSFDVSFFDALAALQELPAHQ